MDVKRFDIHMHSDDVHFLRESNDGDYVKFVDFDALAAERDALKAGTDAQVWFHLQMENHRLTTERDSLLEALRGSKEALENGACTFDAMAAINDAYISRVGRGPEEWAQARAAWLDKESERNRLHASQLHALLEIVK